MDEMRAEIMNKTFSCASSESIFFLKYINKAKILTYTFLWYSNCLQNCILFLHPCINDCGIIGYERMYEKTHFVISNFNVGIDRSQGTR